MWNKHILPQLCQFWITVRFLPSKVVLSNFLSITILWRTAGISNGLHWNYLNLNVVVSIPPKPGIFNPWLVFTWSLKLNLFIYVLLFLFFFWGGSSGWPHWKAPFYRFYHWLWKNSDRYNDTKILFSLNVYCFIFMLLLNDTLLNEKDK